MSTSDPNLLVLPASEAQGSADSPLTGFVPQGLPSAAQLALMANEIFSATPDAPMASQAVSPHEALAGGTLPTPSAGGAPSFRPELSLPSDPHLPTLPASVGPATVAPLTAQYQAAPPSVPGAAATVSEELPAPPAFSFLADARPIYTDSFAYSDRPYAAAAPITEFQQPGAPVSTTPVAAVSPSTGPASTQQPPEVAAPPSPSSPAGALPREADVIPSATPFAFLEELRPIFSYPPSAPGPVPAAPDASLPASKSFELSLADEFLRAEGITALTQPGGFGFVEGARPLEPAGRSTSLAPAGFEEDVPRRFDLTSYPFDAETLKRDFPILQERVNGRPLVWLDNAATTQKPQSVIDRLVYFYQHENSNVHRAAHELAARATDAYEAARDKVRRFVNASSTNEIVFVRGATEGINLIAKSWGKRFIQKDDEIVITWLEHHANIVPWQMLCSETGAKLRVAPVDDSGQVLLDEYERLLNSRTRLVSITQVSNALGVVTPAQKMIEIAHRYGAKVLLDGAQSVSHMRVDVQALDCDFFVFSGHKVFGPTGIGVVYGKPDVLASMPAWQGGGNMIQDVTFEKTVYHGPPQRFEAGTGNIADAVGLGAAIDYLDRVGMPNVARHEHDLLVHATEELLRVPGLHVVGTAREKAGVLSFVLDGFRTEEVGDFLNKNGIAVRSGHHCAQPILRRFGYESTVRASFALYNTHDDVERLVRAIWDLRTGRTSVS